MKKHFTLLSCLCLASGFYAQNLVKNAPEKMKALHTGKPTSTTTPSPNKAVGQVIWSDNFDNASNWGMDNDGQTGGNFGWNINNTKQSWYGFPAFASTSGGNNAELGNGVPSPSPGTQAVDVVYTLTSKAIDITGDGTNLALSFQQYGARFYDLQEWQVSKDSVTWVSVGNNEGLGQLSAGGGSAYDNPMEVSTNISSAIAGAGNEIWVRFRWTTGRPDVAPSNPSYRNVWITYGWFIDDVKISTLSDNDLVATGDYWGSEGLSYYMIPTTQVAPIDFSAFVHNAGSQTLTNVTFNVNITGGSGFSGSSTPATLTTMQNDTLELTAQFTPSTAATYTVARSLTLTQTDDVPANNVLPGTTFSVGGNIYARDNNVVNGYTTNNGNTAGFETGNAFDIFANQVVKGVTVRFATASPVDGSATVYARIYDAMGAELVPVAECDPIELTAAMIGSDYTFVLNQPFVQLDANKTYFVMVGSDNGGVRVANAGSSLKQTSFFLDGNQVTDDLFYQLETPYVRLNFDPTLSVDNIEAVAGELTVSPNPFSDEVAFNFTLKSDATVSAVITDLSGRTVMTVPAAAMNAGQQSIAVNGSAFKAGVYNYTLTVNGTSVTKRIVKK